MDPYKEIELFDCPFCSGPGLLEEEGGWCWYVVCADCGAYLDEMTEAERSEHIKAHVMSEGSGSHCTKQFREKTGVRVIEHPAQYRTVHHEAEGHEETVIIGWRCSCGAEK